MKQLGEQRPKLDIFWLVRSEFKDVDHGQMSVLS